MKQLCLLSVLLVAASAFCQDAFMFRGNPMHTGVYAGQGIAHTPTVKWKTKTGAGVMSSAAVENGTVYIGSNDHNLYAIDAGTGEVKWKFHTGGRVTSSPAVAAGVVYFESYDSNFYAVDAITGKLRWKFATEGERRFAARHLHGSEPAAETMPDPFDFYLSSPVVAQESVYFGSGDGNVYSLDAATGHLRWKFHTGDVVHASPALANGTLFIGSWDSYFYALDAASGKAKWRFKTGEDPDMHNQVGIQSSAAVAEGVVYFGCRDSNLYALDAATGQKKWAFNNKGSWVIGSPAVRDGKVYFATSDSGLFYVLDAKSGTPVFSLHFARWPLFSSPAVVGDMVYVGSNVGKVFAIDLAQQKLAWEFVTDASRENGPALTKADGTPNYEAIFPDNFYDNMMAGVARTLTNGAILSSPVMVNGVLYFGSTDGFVYALN